MSIRKESPLLHYELLEQIGDGTFGSVHKGIKKTSNAIVAIKMMKRKVNDDHLKECKTLTRMSTHPHIVQLYEAYIDAKKEIYFVMEYMNGGNLYQLIQDRKNSMERIKTSEIKSMTSQVLAALKHIHHVEGIFHRDIKPENLLIHYQGDAMILKLADFGLATDLKSKVSATDYVSTRWYRAPEVLLKSSRYSYPIDLWALGAIFAELITLRPLFPGQSESDQLARISQVLGNPGAESNIPHKKSYRLLRHHKSLPFMQPLETNLGPGGEWKEGVRLAHKMKFEFLQAPPDSLASSLKPNCVSKEALDLLLRFLQYDPCRRITSSEALCHPFLTSNSISSPTIMNYNDKPTLFDLPIIPLSPLEESKPFSSFVHHEKQSSPHTLSRTISYLDLCQPQHHQTMERSISDLSVSQHMKNATLKQQTSGTPIKRFKQWAKKHVTPQPSS